MCKAVRQLTILLQGDGTIMGGIVVMRPVTHEVEYIFPENEFGTYPDIEEVSDANTASRRCHD